MRYSFPFLPQKLSKWGNSANSISRRRERDMKLVYEPLFRLFLMLIHSYWETEKEIYASLPGILAYNAVSLAAKKFGGNPVFEEISSWDINDLVEALKDSELIEDGVALISGNEAVFIVEGCKYARYLHQSLNREFLCPYALLAFLLLRNTYRDVKFAGRLSELTENGSRTIFIVHGKTLLRSMRARSKEKL